LFKIGEPEAGNNYTKVARKNVKLAIKGEKGLAFWIRELGERRAKVGLCKTDYVYDRRFICADCVSGVLKPLHSSEA
jgi:hypothetical protein